MMLIVAEVEVTLCAKCCEPSHCFSYDLSKKNAAVVPTVPMGKLRDRELKRRVLGQADEGQSRCSRPQHQIVGLFLN